MDILPSSENRKISLDIPEIKNQTIFYCILNWGIGHASRSIPIIDLLLKNGNKVILFSDGEAAKLVSNYFPNLALHTLSSYNVKYSSNRFLFFELMLASLKSNKSIKKEQEELNMISSKYDPDVVISDNRYGCFLENTTNYIITHQLRINTGLKLVDKLSEKMVRGYLKPFDEVWVPDDKNVLLSGNLALPEIKQPKRWIGLPSLSNILTFEKKPVELLILLSGPEPRRSILEEKLLSIFKKLPYQVTFIAGNFSTEYHTYSEDNLTYFSFKPYPETLSYLYNAKMVVCRSGYSTLIDLYNLKKEKIVCIPTLGQPEQEYLADYWDEKGWVKKVAENEIDSRLPDTISKLM